MRIAIIGHAGSGKTYLANRISQRFSIPHLHLDRIFLTSGGDKTNRTDEETNKVRQIMREKIQEFLKENNEWVSDGTYTRMQPMIADIADKVIYLDIPLWKRQLNHMKRIFYRKNRHREVSFLQDLYFTYDMVRRTRNSKSRVEDLTTRYKDKLTVLKSQKEVDDYINRL